jgi:hypothetical protein
MENYEITLRERFSSELKTVSQKGWNVKDAIERLEQKGERGTVYDCRLVNEVISHARS